MASFLAPLLVGGLSALGGLFEGNKQTAQSTTNTTPNFTPQQQAMISMLTGQYANSINGAPAWNKAYQTGGLQNFLNSSINANQNASSVLSSRGVDRTTAGAQAVSDTGYQEGNQIASFLTNAPVVEQQNLNTLLNQASSFNASLPVGTTTSSNSSGTGGVPLNPVAGILGGGAQGAAAVLGQQTAATTLGNILKQLPTNNTTTNTGAGGGGTDSSLVQSSPYASDNFSDDTGEW